MKTKEQLHEIEKDGRRAALKGKERDKNPYLEDSQSYWAWRSGWNSAERGEIFDEESKNFTGSDITPIQHDGSASIMRLRVCKLTSSRGGDSIIVQAEHKDEDLGVEFAVVIKNPRLPSISINDTLEIRLKVVDNE